LACFKGQKKNPPNIVFSYHLHFRFNHAVGERRGKNPRQFVGSPVLPVHGLQLPEEAMGSGIVD
jgi:hypothetical protein